MSKHKHPVKVELLALMSDAGEIKIPERTINVDVSDLEPVKEWCDDGDIYVLQGPCLPGMTGEITTTCGVVRELRNR